MNNDQENYRKFAPQGEPLFMAIPHDDASFQAAYDRAATTIPEFVSHLERAGDSLCCAKLRFRNPDLSERSSEDRFLFLWLSEVHYHATEGVFSGTFFEVPPELRKWHQVGQRLAFESEDIFDWMVNEQGHLYGGFTLRVAREKLPEAERASYDRYVGVSSYEPFLSA